MDMQPTYPRVVSAQALAGTRLKITFSNGHTRIYDCTPLLSQEAFVLLRDEALFRAVRPDPHGYGVVWNDEIDLAESELWINGCPEVKANRAAG